MAGRGRKSRIEKNDFSNIKRPPDIISGGLFICRDSKLRNIDLT
jgi:hypothetical protein